MRQDRAGHAAGMPDDDTTADGGSPAVDPEPHDRPPREEPDVQPELKAAGSTGWQALAAPGKPDGEVDTRPDVPDSP